MSEPCAIDRRGKDVLFALAAALNFEQRLGRLCLQKFIYLFDVLALAWREIGGGSTFRPWHNGPYDLLIQNAVDSLAFRGFVEISNLSFRQTRNTGCNYSLTSTGKIAVQKLGEQKSLGNDLLLFQEIALEVNRRGWQKIKNIVYCEPTFNLARATHRGQALPLNDPNGNISWQLLSDVRSAFEVMRDQPMSRRSLVQVFFALLDEYESSPDRKLGEVDN
jgi:hypothetical protein